MIKNGETRTVLEKFKSYGKPSIFHCDKGKEFCSNFLKSYS